MPEILIGADICPIGRNTPLFEQGNAGALFNSLLTEFQSADLVVANLECPLIERPSPIQKTGPVFGESSACINGIKAAGISVLNLANNHINDHGPAGVLNTIEVCRRASIDTVGGGADLHSASRILVRKVGSLRVGILSVAEHEFSIATQESPGANPLDLIDLVRTIRKHNRLFDHLIILFHGGDEFHVPSPRVQKTCRFMIEIGADLVVVQHPHVLGGYELYRDGYIVYGQGALIMDEKIYREEESFHTGFLVRLSLSHEASPLIEFLPFEQSFPEPGARLLQGGARHRFLNALEERSRAVTDERTVENEWRLFCNRKKHSYMSTVLGHGRILRKLNRNGLATKFLLGNRSLLGTRNVVMCETHHEVLATILGSLVSEGHQK